MKSKRKAIDELSARMLIRRTNKNFLKMCGGKFISEYLYIKEIL